MPLFYATRAGSWRTAAGGTASVVAAVASQSLIWGDDQPVAAYIAIDRSAYRIVQEAVTNVVRHADRADQAHAWLQAVILAYESRLVTTRGGAQRNR